MNELQLQLPCFKIENSRKRNLPRFSSLLLSNSRERTNFVARIIDRRRKEKKKERERKKKSGFHQVAFRRFANNFTNVKPRQRFHTALRTPIYRISHKVPAVAGAVTDKISPGLHVTLESPRS